MKKEEELLRSVTELIKETQSGHKFWEIQCQTTEYKDPAEKQVEKEDGIDWTVDECFVSYHCTHQDKEFLMITYEKLYANGETRKSENLIFLPPLGIRFFDLDTLAPYAVKADQMLIYDIHMLWLSILEQYRKNPQSANITVSQR